MRTLELKSPEIGFEDALVTPAEAEDMQAHFDMPSPDSEDISGSDRPAHNEKYGISLSSMRAVGEIALSGSADMDRSGEVAQLRGEFYSCVFEGLSSDKEYGEGLQVTKFDKWEVKGGQVMSGDGTTPVSEIVENGYQASKREAEQDLRMLAQVRRDDNDRGVIKRVDSMVSGKESFNTLIDLSCDPKEAIKRDGIGYWNKKGYVEDLVYAHMYHWTGGELVTGALSFKAKDLSKLREALAKRGVDVPENVHPDDLINHHYTLSLSDSEQAKEQVLGLREECSDTPAFRKTDTVDIVENQQSMNAVFNEMYVPITASLALEQKTDRVGKIISAFGANSQYFRPEVRNHLARMGNKETINDDDARLLHQLSVYAAIERVRAEIATGTSGLAPSDILLNPGSFGAGIRGINGLEEYERAAEGFIASMGGFVQIGSSAGRTYSSCGSALQLTPEGLKEFDYGWGMNIPQDIFGGHLKKEEEDRRGALVFSCGNGHTNKRKPGELLARCQTRPCKAQVAC
jgi:hypothetical protein